MGLLREWWGELAVRRSILSFSVDQWMGGAAKDRDE